MKVTRRAFALGSTCLAGLSNAAGAGREISVISATVSLGLRPGARGQEPGSWRAPEVLLNAGLAAKLGARERIDLARPDYDFNERPGTRIRNGDTLRAFMLELGEKVRGELVAGRFPVVLGGDCSVMLGCLYGARRAGGRGLVHVDGHSDFFHPGNYDTKARLGSAAGMRQSVAEAVWHARHRSAFGALLADQPAMTAVLADLALESEAATVTALRLARAHDDDASDEEVAFRRLATAVAKYWVLTSCSKMRAR